MSKFIHKIQPASPTEAGILKLFDRCGYNTDGAMTQRVITKGFSQVKFSLSKEENECLELKSIELEKEEN